MGFSAIGRRCIARSESLGILRCRRSRIGVADVVYSDSSYFRANRKMSSGSVTSPEPCAAAAPVLMLPPTVDGRGNIAYTFHSLAHKGEFPLGENKIGGDGDEVRLPSDLIKDVKFVGSTHGWLALYNRRNRDLFLSNPVTQRHIKLPPSRTVDRIVLSSDPDEEASSLAFKSGGEGGLAFCSPRRNNEWTVFGTEDYVYDSLVYSSRHRRLFCVAFSLFSKLKCAILESWDVGGEVPRLDWTIRPKRNVMTINPQFYASCLQFDWPDPMERKKLFSQLRYVVCAEHSGDLFLVVRYVNLRAGPRGSIANKVVYSEYVGCNFTRTPYKTADFDVYKVDMERRRVIWMKDSLEGLAIFVGINHPLAILPSAAGLKPDCVYFTDENRLVEATRLERTNYGGHDNGIFDYRNKEISPCCDSYPVAYDQIRKSLPLPLWFVPTTTTAR